MHKCLHSLAGSLASEPSSKPQKEFSSKKFFIQTFYFRMRTTAIGLNFTRPAETCFCGANVGIKRMQGLSADNFSKQGMKEYCGSITIKDKMTQKPIEVDFYKTTFQKNASEIYFMTEKNGKIVGNMTLTIDKEAIFVANIESLHRKKYSGVGSALIQLAVEKSLEHNSSPPIKLNAKKLHILQRSPVGFYEKLGFVKDKDAKESDINFFGTPMSLYPKCDSRWLKKVKEKPILKQSV